jgi:hypothetical protein
MSRDEIATQLGRFRMVGTTDAPLVDRWSFCCPGCGQWAYLDDDQWHGRVSVDHASMGCPGGYHETHDYFTELSRLADPVYGWPRGARSAQEGDV